MSQNVSSAAVVVGALMVMGKRQAYVELIVIFFSIQFVSIGQDCINYEIKVNQQ